MKNRLGRCVAIVAMTTTCLIGLAPVAVAHEASRDRARPAQGEFTAAVDFTSVQTRDRGRKCEFVVNGTLTFTGTIEGVASGTTTALISAPCDKALASPPGTYFDTFRFAGEFSGSVLGRTTNGRLRYTGVTLPGGDINAVIFLSGEKSRAVLRADATVAVGGTYSGFVTRR